MSSRATEWILVQPRASQLEPQAKHLSGSPFKVSLKALNGCPIDCVLKKGSILLGVLRSCLL